MDSKGLKVQAYTRKPVATRTDLNRSGSGLAHTRNTRKSAGNIYEEIMGQMEVEHNKYIRQLVTRNQREAKEQVHPGSAKKQPMTHFAIEDQQRTEQTHLTNGRQSQGMEDRLANNGRIQITSFLSQHTPKQSCCKAEGDQQQRFQEEVLKAKRRKEKHVHQSTLNQYSDETFIEGIDSYLSALKTKTNESGGSKLNSTLKFNEETCKLSAKLEAAIGKIKELKLKNHVLEKEQVRIVRKEKKMKESLYQMMDQIRFLNSELVKEKKQKRKLEKIITSFQANIKRCKPERKTAGVSKLRNNPRDFQSELHLEATDQDSDLLDMQEIKEFNSSYKWKNKASNKPVSNEQGQPRWNFDDEKIDGLFRANFSSNESEGGRE